MSDWASIPADILEIVADNLDSYGDFLRCRAVCTHWCNALPKTTGPCLFLSFKNSGRTTWTLFNLINKRFFNLENHVQAQGKTIIGYSFGWLFVVAKHDSALSLIQPLTRSQIELPPITSFPYKYFHRYTGQDKVWLQRLFIRKIVLSGTPSDDPAKYMAAAIFGANSELAYCSIGDKKWKKFRCKKYNFEDVIFHKGKLFAVTGDSFKENVVLITCDPNKSSRKWSVRRIDRHDRDRAHLNPSRAYFVGHSSEELWLVQMSHCGLKRSPRFYIYKVNESGLCDEIEGLKDDQVLVLTDYSCMCMKVLRGQGKRVYCMNESMENCNCKAGTVGNGIIEILLVYGLDPVIRMMDRLGGHSPGCRRYHLYSKFNGALDLGRSLLLPYEFV